MRAKKRVAILISGRGSNMLALITAARASHYPAEISCVVSDRADAEGLKKSAAAGVPAAVIDHRGRETFEATLDDYLRSRKIEFIALAGFMRVLSAKFIAAWPDRIVNIHPSLLPDYKGLNTHARVLVHGASHHGCTVHVVRADVDSGPIIAQARIEVRPDDTAETLAARVLTEEHQLYPRALALIVSGRVKIDGDQVKISG